MRSSFSLILFFLGVFCQSMVFAADFKTYKNEHYGFEIQHPVEWFVRELNEDGKEKTISFQDKTEDNEWISIMKYGNTAPVFEIEVYTYTLYQQAENYCSTAKKEGYEPSFCLRLLNEIGRNGRYIFVAQTPRSGAFATPNNFSYETHTLKSDESLKTFIVYPEK